MARRASALLLVFAIAGCDRPNDKICTTPTPEPQALEWLKQIPDAEPGVAVSMQERYLDNCILKWAYRVAKSPDPSPVAAEAVLGACLEPIERTVLYRDMRRSSEARQGLVDLPAYSIETGKGVTNEVRAFEKYRRLSLFYVVQARAGNCAVP